MENRINKDLISNIEIDEDMKKTLYRNCIKKRRTADFRFRYSGVLTALIIVIVFGVFSIGTSAAIISFRSRLANMDTEEFDSYAAEVDADTFISTDEGFSRELTIKEIKKVIELERKYYDEGVFPKKNMPHYETFAERGKNELAYVVSDNIVYLPEKDMNDEQILEYIDHDAKKRYVNILELKADGFEPGQGMALESTPLTSGSIEEKTKKAADKYLKDYYGLVTDDSWIVLVDIFDESEDKYGNMMTLGVLHYYQLGTGYATCYDLYINADDMSLLMIGEAGYGSIIDSEAYTYAEAEEYVAEREQTALNAIKKEFGYENPDSIKYDFEGFNLEDGKTASVNFEMEFSGRTVYSEVRIEDSELLFLSRFLPLLMQKNPMQSLLQEMYTILLSLLSLP